MTRLLPFYHSSQNDTRFILSSNDTPVDRSALKKSVFATIGAKCDGVIETDVEREVHSFFRACQELDEIGKHTNLAMFNSSVPFLVIEHSDGEEVSFTLLGYNFSK